MRFECRTRLFVTAILVAGFAALALPVAAQQQGEWRVGTRLIRVDVDAVSGPIGGTGTGIAFGSAWTLDFDATYMVDHQWGIEFMLTASRHDMTGAGGINAGLDIGNVWIGEGIFTLQYYLPLYSDWAPYFGAGLGTAVLFSSSVTDEAMTATPGSISKVKSDLEFGAALQVGVGYKMSRTLWLSADLKYNDVNADIEVTAPGGERYPKVRANLGPWILGIGVSYRF